MKNSCKTCSASPVQELDKDQHIERLLKELDSLDMAHRDSQTQVSKCENIIEQLTQELTSAQGDLNAANTRIKECDKDIVSLKQRLQDSQHEVRCQLQHSSAV